MFHVHYFLNFVNFEFKTNRNGFKDVKFHLEKYAYTFDFFEENIFVYTKEVLGKKFKLVSKSTTLNDDYFSMSDLLLNYKIFTILNEKKYKYNYEVIFF
jgi:hypothetical protein